MRWRGYCESLPQCLIKLSYVGSGTRPARSAGGHKVHSRWWRCLLWFWIAYTVTRIARIVDPRRLRCASKELWCQQDATHDFPATGGCECKDSISKARHFAYRYSFFSAWQGNGGTDAISIGHTSPIDIINNFDTDKAYRLCLQILGIWAEQAGTTRVGVKSPQKMGLVSSKIHRNIATQPLGLLCRDQRRQMQGR